MVHLFPFVPPFLLPFLASPNGLHPPLPFIYQPECTSNRLPHASLIRRVVESIDIFSSVTPFSQESLDILPHLLLRRPPLWVSIYLSLPVFLQVPGFSFECFLQDEPLAKHYLCRR